MKNIFTLPFYIIVFSIFLFYKSFSQTETQAFSTVDETKALEYEKATWYEFKDAAVTFTFDDAYLNHFKIAMPMLEQRGFRGTFYVVTSRVGDGQTPVWDTLAAIAAKGHEIGSHTVNHALMATIYPSNKDSSKMELDSSKRRIDRHIFPEKCETMCWPGGSVNYQSTVLGSQYYISCRGSGYILQPNIPYDFYNVYSKGPYSDTTSQIMNGWVDQVITKKGWLIDRIHGIDTNGYEPVPSSEFAIHFDYIKSHENQLWVATYKNVIKYIRERMYASLKLIDSTSSYYSFSLTDNLANDVYNLPLTLKVKLKGQMNNLLTISQNNDTLPFTIINNNGFAYAVFSAIPDNGEIRFCLPPNGIKNDNKVDQKLSCYPNPFKSNSSISYFINKKDYVSLNLYDLNGKKVKSLVNKIQNTGVYCINFNVENLHPSAYILKLETNNKQESIKISINK